MMVKKTIELTLSESFEKHNTPNRMLVLIPPKIDIVFGGNEILMDKFYDFIKEHLDELELELY